MSEVPALSPVELKSELESGANLLLLDVRETDELEISSLPGIIHIPLGEIEDRYSEIPKDRDVVVICRTGGRKPQMVPMSKFGNCGIVANLLNLMVFLT